MVADPRELLKETWSDENPEELRALVLDLWRETLTASKRKTVKGIFECQKCQHRNLVEVPVEVPDIATRAKAFAVFADQAFGKVPETRRVEVDAGERTLAALERMSMAELMRLADLDVVEGEFSEVGSAPELPPAA